MNRVSFACLSARRGLTAILACGALAWASDATAQVAQEIIPTAETAAATWRYTLAPPAGEWTKPDYDDSGWKTGESGFGEKYCPGATIRTEWLTDDIWLRRSVTLDHVPEGALFLLMHHDEDAEVYVNGVLAAKVKGFVTEYVEVPLLPEAKAALKKGSNLLAVHCKQTAGGQSIDVGLAEKSPAK
jgi:hypothetical protein